MLIRKNKGNTDQNSINEKIKKNTPTIWWDERCARAIRIRKAKWLSLQHKFTSKEFFEYKKIEAQTKITLKTEKKKHS